MKTQLLTGGNVLLDLTIEEHVALSRVLCSLMSSIEPASIPTTLFYDLDSAYEFQYSVYLREAAARVAGIRWLPAGECSDSFVAGNTARPTVDIRFDADGSLWRVTSEQLTFIERCVDVRSLMTEQAFEVV